MKVNQVHDTYLNVIPTRIILGKLLREPCCRSEILDSENRSRGAYDLCVRTVEKEE
jgi:hypothetical protein